MPVNWDWQDKSKIVYSSYVFVSYKGGGIGFDKKEQKENSQSIVVVAHYWWNVLPFTKRSRIGCSNVSNGTCKEATFSDRNWIGYFLCVLWVFYYTLFDEKVGSRGKIVSLY